MRLGEPHIKIHELRVERICQLLAETDMSASDIAERMGVHRGTVNSINRKFRIRNYGKARHSWTVAGHEHHQST